MTVGEGARAHSILVFGHSRVWRSLAWMAHCVTLIGIRRGLLPAAVDFVKGIDGNSYLAGDPWHDPVKAGESATVRAVSHAKKVR